MEISSLCPFSSSVLVWAPRPGDQSVTVCVKATFSLEPGKEATLADRQEGAHDDIPWEDGPAPSLYAPSDHVPFKPRVDVLLVGHAYAPGGAPVSSLSAQLRIGDLSKTLRVAGDRTWVQTPEGLRPSVPVPFTAMPLRYERAARRGDNPIGLHLAQAAAGQRLPNIIDSAEDGRMDGTPGFGPIHPRWRAHRDRLSESSFHWAAGLRGAAGADVPAPERFDFGFFNAAPRDQQLDELREGAALLLEHLHPRVPRFEARLPAIRPKVFYVNPASGWHSELSMRCDTVWIDADRALAVVSWRGILPVGGPVELTAGRLLVASEGPGEKVRYEDVARLEADGAAGALVETAKMSSEKAPEPEADLSGTITGDFRAMKELMPFRPGPSALAVPSPAARVSLESLSNRAAEANALLDSASPDGTYAMTGPFISGVDPLPFQKTPAPAGGAKEEAREELPPPLPQRPAMLGPLPEPEKPIGAESTARVEEKPPLGAPLPAEPVPEPDPEPDPEPGTFPIERCASITAEIDLNRGKSAPILDAHRLSLPGWKAIEKHWARSIRQETNRGKTALLGAFDAAYVAMLEERRGPITMAELARILIGVEQQRSDEVLDALKLPHAALMRIQRVGMKRVAADKALAAEMRRAMEAAREE